MFTERAAVLEGEVSTIDVKSDSRKTTQLFYISIFHFN